MPEKSWWARLPFGVRMTAGACSVLMVIGGGVAGISTLVTDEPHVVRAAARESAVSGRPGAAAAEVAPAEDTGTELIRPPVAAGSRPHVLGDRGQAADTSRVSDQADRTATREPREAPTVSGGQPRTTAPVITTRTVTETRTIPFRTTFVRDESLPRGARRVQTPGVAGQETLRYLVTYTSGTETGRRLLDTTVTRQPQRQVIAIGTRHSPDGDGHGKPQECGAGLNGTCVPISRSALCPDDPQPDASGAPRTDAPGGDARRESGTALDDDLYVIDPADLADLDLLCD
jgi:hypothetical protein